MCVKIGISIGMRMGIEIGVQVDKTKTIEILSVLEGYGDGVEHDSAAAYRVEHKVEYGASSRSMAENSQGLMNMSPNTTLEMGKSMGHGWP